MHVDNCVITVPASEAKENGIVESSKASIPVKKGKKAIAGAKAESATTKKADTKIKAGGTESSKAKKTKAAGEKVESEKVEKPGKVAKEKGPKAKK
ncbi:MAG: hypothetical protein M3Z56_08760 [Bacteroidota bacterium]|nr:hypothetical protein [Bacteroidota bacterium]